MTAYVIIAAWCAAILALCAGALGGCDLNARGTSALKELEIAQRACAADKGSFSFEKKWTGGDHGWPYYEYNCKK